MSNYSPALVFGFHVCDRAVRDRLVLAQDDFRISRNDYDWLGEGVYFFESDPERASLFGDAIKQEPRLSKGEIDDPVVLGAVIELDHCLDLTTVAGRRLLSEAERMLPASAKLNKGAGRYRDCAAINTLCQLYSELQQPPFTTVRAAFQEGAPVYESAVLHAEDHIQIAVRDPNCIKGVFVPRHT